MQNKLLVAYHSPCMDGYGAACAHFVNSEFKDTIYKSVSYSFLAKLPTFEFFPWRDETLTHILFLDICPTADTLDYLTKEKGFVITILDHHETAKNILKDYDNPNVRYLLADNFSGASLAKAIDINIDQIVFDPNFQSSGQNYIIETKDGVFNTNMPDEVINLIDRSNITGLYELLEIRDIWITTDPEMKEKADNFAAFVKFHNLAKEPVGDLTALVKDFGGFEGVVEKGQLIDQVHRETITSAIEASYQTKVVLKNNTVIDLCIGVCPLNMGSMFGDHWNTVSEGDSIAIALTYNLRTNEIGVSVRSDCKLARLVAEQIGGGGHDNAAGGVIRPHTRVGDLPSVNAIIRRFESIVIDLEV